MLNRRATTMILESRTLWLIVGHITLLGKNGNFQVNLICLHFSKNHEMPMWRFTAQNFLSTSVLFTYTFFLTIPPYILLQSDNRMRKFQQRPFWKYDFPSSLLMLVFNPGLFCDFGSLSNLISFRLRKKSFEFSKAMICVPIFWHFVTQYDSLSSHPSSDSFLNFQSKLDDSSSPFPQLFCHHFGVVVVDLVFVFVEKPSVNARSLSTAFHPSPPRPIST